MKTHGRAAPFALLLLVAPIFSPSLRAGESASPVGLWNTMDEKSGKPNGVLRIFERQGSYFARIERTFTPSDERRLCTACTGERKNQPIVGLVIMRNMKLTDGSYQGGDILDPDSGSTYHCKFELTQAGTRLVIRGYIGIPLLGRSQTWERAS